MNERTACRSTNRDCSAAIESRSIVTRHFWLVEFWHRLYEGCLPLAWHNTGCDWPVVHSKANGAANIGVPSRRNQDAIPSRPIAVALSRSSVINTSNSVMKYFRSGTICFAAVLSQWDHFTVCRFICVYLCVFCVFLFHTAQLLYYGERGGVDLTGLKSNP